MAKIVCMKTHKNRTAADRGFREWRRIFRSIADFHEHAKWADLPNEVLPFFCEEGPESKHAFYDLLMRSHRLVNGHDFETQAFDRLSMLLNAYFFIVDQARFECMRRLGWLETIPRGGQPIIEVVMESGTYDYAALDEYQKALILESLREGPQSVREVAGNTGLPVHTVSVRLNDLERRGLAELKGYEGTTPRFVRLVT